MSLNDAKIFNKIKYISNNISIPTSHSNKKPNDYDPVLEISFDAQKIHKYLEHICLNDKREFEKLFTLKIEELIKNFRSTILMFDPASENKFFFLSADQNPKFFFRDFEYDIYPFLNQSLENILRKTLVIMFDQFKTENVNSEIADKIKEILPDVMDYQKEKNVILKLKVNMFDYSFLLQHIEKTLENFGSGQKIVLYQDKYDIFYQNILKHFIKYYNVFGDPRYTLEFLMRIICLIIENNILISFLKYESFHINRTYSFNINYNIIGNYRPLTERCKILNSKIQIQLESDLDSDSESDEKLKFNYSEMEEEYLGEKKIKTPKKSIKLKEKLVGVPDIDSPHFKKFFLEKVEKERLNSEIKKNINLDIPLIFQNQAGNKKDLQNMIGIPFVNNINKQSQNMNSNKNFNNDIN